MNTDGYRKALILGAGISGAGAARLLANEGVEVVVADRKPLSSWSVELREVFRRLDVRCIGDSSEWERESYDVGVLSPGFALNAPWTLQSRICCRELIPEFELGWRRFSVPTMAVTGSNGKSTLVQWISVALRAAGLRVVTAGNIGRSVCEAAIDSPPIDWLLLEVSSFQLEAAACFRAEIACLTNIHPNHLDRHGDLETYIDCKARLFSHSGAGDVCIVPQALCAWMQSRFQGRGNWQTFGLEAGADYMWRNGMVYAGERVAADFRGSRFAEAGFGYTAAAGIAMLSAADVSACHAENAALRFEPLPHRLQQVATSGGVTWIDDSKATNLAATAHALRAINAPVHLVAGGLPKERDFEIIKEVLARKAKCVYLIGRAAEQMSSVWSSVVPCRICGTMEHAVREAAASARAGDVVLLSPGCASFDQYADYGQRGDHFVELVRETIGKETS